MRWVGLLGLSLACQANKGASPPPPLRAEGSAVPAAPSTGPRVAPPEPQAPAPSATSALPAWPPPAPGIATDFCTEATTALDEETCYVLPDARTSELMLYLHGTIPPGKTSPQKTNLGAVLANAAKRGQFAALLPRGGRGLAPASQKDWWGWPTSAEQYQRYAPEMVAKFAEKRQKLEALVGAPFERLYVAGSSSGAYFAAALALRGELTADGYAAISGGAWVEHPRTAELTPRPFYVGFGRHDTVAPGARRLGERLRAAGWLVSVAVHPLPHGAREVYLDEAVAFFRALTRRDTAW